MLATGPYTVKSGDEQGKTYLAGADGKLFTKSHNSLVKYGNKHYVVSNESVILKDGKYSVGYGWTKAFTDAENTQIMQTSLSAWGDGNTFYTDKNGVVIKNKVITTSTGNKVRLSKYGIEAGPLFKQGGKWYCYNYSGAVAPGKYKVKAKIVSTEKEEDAYITIGKDGMITGGVRRSDGSAIQGFVRLDDSDIVDGYYFLDKKGLPSTGTKATSLGKLTFNSVSGRTEVLH